jgi:glycosyltransferase involved in cell wall biosynthesis
MTTSTGTTLLIEGWRGINHSFALVNQCQILELLKFKDLRLFHRDLPFFMPHWNAANIGAGFSERDRGRIASLSEPGPAPVDAVYRAGFPYGGALTQSTMTFMVTECGLSSASFLPEGPALSDFTRDGNCVVTPTAWSRDRLVEYGLDSERVHVIPHGVNTATFNPLAAAERSQNRNNLGIPDGALVFLNLGVATWNKGIDTLLLAFAQLRMRHPQRSMYLILKDQRSLYRLSVESVLLDVAGHHPELFGAETLACIRVVGTTLSQAQLRLLYGIADAYVSPYRAEGFNLPVLEAIACGTPVIVTEGGATDDFCLPGSALRIRSRPGCRKDPNDGAMLRFREPDFDMLVDAMGAFLSGRPAALQGFAQARTAVLAAMTWERAAVGLRALMAGSLALAPAGAPS